MIERHDMYYQLAYSSVDDAWLPVKTYLGLYPGNEITSSAFFPLTVFNMALDSVTCEGDFNCVLEEICRGEER